MSLTLEDLQVLKAPFAAKDHEFLNGNAYITESAITNRLDAIDPDWSFRRIEITSRGNTITAAYRMTVKGVERDNVGMAQVVSKNEREVNEAEKSAVTDALKRCARLFGVGRYLLDLPQGINDHASMERYLNNTPRQSAQTKQDAPAQSKTEPTTDEPETRDMVATVVEIKTDRNKKPYLLYIAGDGTKASGRGRDTLKTAGYDTDAWKVEAGAKYALHPPALVKISKSGQFWNVVEGSASKYDQALQPTGTTGTEIPF